MARRGTRCSRFTVSDCATRLLPLGDFSMRGLREAGYATSGAGKHGGWTMACDLRAVGGPHLFAIGVVNQHPDCAVDKVVNHALGDALQRAEAILIESLGNVVLADLAQRFGQLCVAGGVDQLAQNASS